MGILSVHVSFTYISGFGRYHHASYTHQSYLLRFPVVRTVGGVPVRYMFNDRSYSLLGLQMSELLEMRVLPLLGLLMSELVEVGVTALGLLLSELFGMRVISLGFLMSELF